MIEKDFVSELFYAQVMGLPTKGLSPRWAKTVITKAEAEEFCRRRTEQEVADLREKAKRGEKLDGDGPSAEAVAASALEASPWRLPTSEEWEADFNAEPFQHFRFGWTSTVEDAAVVIRGGSWDDRPSVARASYRVGDGPGERNAYIGFRCAR